MYACSYYSADSVPGLGAKVIAMATQFLAGHAPISALGLRCPQ